LYPAQLPDLFKGDPKVLANPTGKKWYDLVKAGKGAEAAVQIIIAFSQGTFPKEIMYFPGTPGYRSAWKETIEAADGANEPGRFTAFIGFEWTSNTGGNNLHRVCVCVTTGPRLEGRPYTVYPPFGSDNPRDLWKYMARYEEQTGGQILAIAHNGNLSNGIMFPMIESFTGQPVDREYAETRAKWEPLYEVTQIKGDGETHPVLTPDDEFAAFERWDKGNLDLSTLKKPEMLQLEYARQALENGLVLEQKLGTNPYKFGMIGSTDSHTGLATADDELLGQDLGLRAQPERATIPSSKEKATIRAGSRPRPAMPRPWRTRAKHSSMPWRARNVRHHRPAHGRALLWRLGLPGPGRAGSHACARRVLQGRPNGRRLEARALG
jgi:hypothetical protein